MFFGEPITTLKGPKKASKILKTSCPTQPKETFSLVGTPPNKFCTASSEVKISG